MAREKNSAEWRAHMATIRGIVDRWLDGELTVTAKREAIAEENKFFHGRSRRSPATGEQLCTVMAAPPEPPLVREPVPAQGVLFAEESEEPWWHE